jgi:hypothetical protein
MGGWISFGLAKYAPERFYSLIIGAMSPYRNQNGPNELLEYFKKGKEYVLNEIETLISMTPQQKTRWMNNDMEAS